VIRTLREAMKGALRPWRLRVDRALWRLRGQPTHGTYASMFRKQERCRVLGARMGCRVLVETGTYWGDMVDAMRAHFDEVHSIELYEPLFERAQRRFRSTKNVYLYLGDSSVRLPDVLRTLDRRALFWLDGHYSGDGTAKADTECPVVAELEAIAAHARNDHCILIDDAHLFGVHPDYPPVDEIVRRLHMINARYDVRVEDNCIIATLPQ
jgi:hypothetical protein